MAVHSYTCGAPFPSGCVLYTGEVPSFIDPDIISCDARLDAIIEGIGDKVAEIVESLDITQLDTACFEFNAETAEIKDVLQEIILQGCDHETRLVAVEDELLNLDISSKLINIDLDCLTPAAAACEQGTDLYTLLSILLTFRSEICAIKTYLNI